MENPKSLPNANLEFIDYFSLYIYKSIILATLLEFSEWKMEQGILSFR